jgi:hypothetical protein
MVKSRASSMRKPGETASREGTYYCYVCALRDETSTCEMKGGQMFVECPRCLERKVHEWDMVWKAVEERPGSRARSSSPWPGFLGKSS